MYQYLAETNLPNIWKRDKIQCKWLQFALASQNSALNCILFSCISLHIDKSLCIVTLQCM